MADNAPASAGGTLRSVNTNGAFTGPGTWGSPGQSTTPSKTQGASCISHNPPDRTPPHGPNTIRFGQPAAGNPKDPINDTDTTLPSDSARRDDLGREPCARRPCVITINQQGVALGWVLKSRPLMR